MLDALPHVADNVCCSAGQSHKRVLDSSYFIAAGIAHRIADKVIQDVPDEQT